MAKKKHKEKATFEFRTISTDKLIGFETTEFLFKEPFTEHDLAYLLVKHEQKLFEEEITCIVSNGDKSDRLLKEMEENDSKILKGKIKKLEENQRNLRQEIGELKQQIRKNL